MWGKIFAFVVMSAMSMESNRRARKREQKRYLAALQILELERIQKEQARLQQFIIHQQQVAAIEAERRRQIEDIKRRALLKFNNEKTRILNEKTFRENLFKSKKDFVEEEGYLLEQGLYACQNSDVSFVDTIFKRDKEIIEYYWSLNPVHIAAEHNCISIINLLLKRGARIETKNASDQLPIDVALEKQHWEAVKTLDQGQKRKKSFFELIKNDNMENIEKYFKQEFDVNTIDEKGYNLIQQAIIHHRGLSIIQRLIELGADLKYKNNEKKLNAEQLARENKLSLIADYIYDEFETRTKVLDKKIICHRENAKLHNGPDLPDIQGWNAVHQYSTIKTHVLFDRTGQANFILVARSSEGIILFCYDFIKEIWQPLANGPKWSNKENWQHWDNYSSIRTEVVKVNEEDKLYLLAWSKEGILLNVFDLQKNTWETLPLGPQWPIYAESGKLSLHLAFHTAILSSVDENKNVQEKLIIIGRTLLAVSAHCYDPKLKQWQDLTSWKQINIDPSIQESAPILYSSAIIQTNKEQYKLALAACSTYRGIHIYYYDFSTKDWNMVNGPIWQDKLAMTRIQHVNTLKLIPVLQSLNQNNLFILARGEFGIELQSFNFNSKTWVKHPNGPAWLDIGGWNDYSYNSTITVKTIRSVEGYDRLILIARGKNEMYFHCYDPKFKKWIELASNPQWADSHLWNLDQHYRTIQFNIGTHLKDPNTILISGKTQGKFIVKSSRINQKMLDVYLDPTKKPTEPKKETNQNVPKPKEKFKPGQNSCLQESISIHKIITQEVMQKFTNSEALLKKYALDCNQYITEMEKALNEDIGKLDHLISQSKTRDIAWQQEIYQMHHDFMAGRQERLREIQEIEEKFKKDRRDAFKKSWIPSSAGYSSNGFTFNGIPFPGGSEPKQKSQKTEQESKPFHSSFNSAKKDSETSSTNSASSSQGASQGTSRSNFKPTASSHSEPHFKQNNETNHFNSEAAEKERNKSKSTKPKSDSTPKWNNGFNFYRTPDFKPDQNANPNPNPNMNAKPNSNSNSPLGSNAASGFNTTSGPKTTPGLNTKSTSNTTSSHHFEFNSFSYSNQNSNFDSSFNSNASSKSNASSQANSNPNFCSNPTTNKTREPSTKNTSAQSTNRQAVKKLDLLPLSKSFSKSNISKLHYDPNAFNNFKKLNFSTAFKATKEFQEIFGFNQPTISSVNSSHNQFKFPNTPNSSATKIDKEKADISPQKSQSDLSNIFSSASDIIPNSSEKFKAYKDKKLNEFAFVSGLTFGFINSMIIESLASLTDAEQLIDDPRIHTKEFNSQMDERRNIIKSKLNSFLNNSYQDITTAAYNNISNKMNSYYDLYKSGKSFEAGFAVGGFTGDVTSYVALGVGSVKTCIKLSQITLDLAPKLGKGLYTSAEFCMSTKTFRYIKQTSFPINEFLATNSFRSPITFQFNPNRLYSGFPIDSIKISKPYYNSKPAVIGQSKKTKANLKIYNENPEIQHCHIRDPKLWQETQNLKFEPAPYHTKKGNSVKSKGPENGQTALYNSITYKPNSSRRIGYDYCTGEFVVLDKTVGNCYHGHVQRWEKLSSEARQAAMNYFGFSTHGKLKFRK